MGGIRNKNNEIYEQIIFHINCFNIALFMQRDFLITIANWDFWANTNIQNKKEWLSNSHLIVDTSYPPSLSRVWAHKPPFYLPKYRSSKVLQKELFFFFKWKQRKSSLERKEIFLHSAHSQFRDSTDVWYSLLFGV